MSTPTRLRTVSGLPDEAPSLKASALILIDLQNTYREGLMQLSEVEPAVKEAQALLRRAREAGTAVFHIRHDAGAGSPYDVGTAIGAISDEVAPQGDEPVITKAYPSAFVGTDLEERLRSGGVRDLVLAGFMTHMCVSSTARDAFSLGFHPTVVAAATATRDLPGLDGSVLPAATLQSASLAALADLFAVVVAGEQEIRA